jgi:hypothetical protein
MLDDIKETLWATADKLASAWTPPSGKASDIADVVVVEKRNWCMWRGAPVGPQAEQCQVRPQRHWGAVKVSMSASRPAFHRGDRRLWVGLRQPTLRIHRQKAGVEGWIPASCRSPTSSFDPGESSALPAMLTFSRQADRHPGAGRRLVNCLGWPISDVDLHRPCRQTPKPWASGEAEISVPHQTDSSASNSATVWRRRISRGSPPSISTSAASGREL